MLILIIGAFTGNIVRADVHTDPTGRPKNSGIVSFEYAEDAQNAIRQFNGYEWNGRYIEVREDRYAGAVQPAFGGGGGGYGGGPQMGGFPGRGGFGPPRGNFAGGRGQFAPRGNYGGPPFGSHRGNFGGGPGATGGHQGGGFSSQTLTPAPPNPFTDFATSGGERSATIFVRNVS